MSHIIVNGIRIEGDEAAVTQLLLAINAVVEAGDTRMVVFEGSHGKTCILVNSSTQAQLTLDGTGHSVIADAFTDNLVETLAFYEKTEPLKG